MPICFEVRINDGPPTITGQSDISVLSACLTFVSARSELEFRAGGLVSNGPHDNEHIDWLQQDLKVGDEVSIRIVDSDSVSVPLGRQRQDPAASERKERAYYERLKRKYESNSSASEG
jgi:predicted RNA-binding protein with RPS1 domain